MNNSRMAFNGVWVFDRLYKHIQAVNVWIVVKKSLTCMHIIGLISLQYLSISGSSLYRVFHVPLFLFCDNFRKCAPILTIFSLVEQEIYDA